MLMLLNGWITDFSEQGMEGEAWRIFQDAAHATSRIAGWRMEGMICLAPGQHLTIYDDAGAALYAGVLRAHRMHWWSRRQLLPVDTRWAPRGILMPVWEGWFRAHPPLAAQLQT
jgi:hypothetical protein